MTKADLLERMEHAHLFLQAALSGLKNERLESDRLGGAWTVRDVMAHLAAWEKEFHEVARILARHNRPSFDHRIEPTDDWRAWNAEQVERRRGMSVGEVFLEMEQAQLAFLQWAQQLPEGRLRHEAEFPWGGRGNLADLLRMVAEHKVGHAHRIRTWRHAGGF